MRPESSISLREYAHRYFTNAGSEAVRPVSPQSYAPEERIELGRSEVPDEVLLGRGYELKTTIDFDSISFLSEFSQLQHMRDVRLVLRPSPVRLTKLSDQARMRVDVANDMVVPVHRLPHTLLASLDTSLGRFNLFAVAPPGLHPREALEVFDRCWRNALSAADQSVSRYAIFGAQATAHYAPGDVEVISEEHTQQVRSCAFSFASELMRSFRGDCALQNGLFASLAI